MTPMSALRPLGAFLLAGVVGGLLSAFLDRYPLEALVYVGPFAGGALGMALAGRPRLFSPWGLVGWTAGLVLGGLVAYYSARGLGVRLFTG